MDGGRRCPETGDGRSDYGRQTMNGVPEGTGDGRRDGGRQTMDDGPSVVDADEEVIAFGTSHRETRRWLMH